MKAPERRAHGPATAQPGSGARERAALGRVAELVARGEPLETVLASIVAETSMLLDVSTAIHRFDERTIRSAAPAPNLAVPIHVNGATWGTVSATSDPARIPAKVRSCLAPFAEIASGAILSAGIRHSLRELVAEQAALRRVAELVARGAHEQTVFDAVAHEAARLIDNEATTLVRFSGPSEFIVVATSGGPVARGVTVIVAPDDQGVVAEILRTRRPARLDNYDERSGRKWARDEYGVGSSVAVPITVDDRLWGVLGVVTQGRQLPSDVEQRLHQFADLVAAAMANTEARVKIQRTADQQRALREVAELSARDAPATDVLDAVARGASELASVDFAMILRFESDGATEIMTLSGTPPGFAVGMRAPSTGDSAARRVWDTRQAARVDDLAAMTGRWPRLAARSGYSKSVGAPILIKGDLWGAIIVASRGELLPPTVEDDLASFAELAAVAIGAAHARQELRALAAEQSGLRRVAELVARAADLPEVFDAVAAEASNLLGGLAAALLRYDPDGWATNVAACNSQAPVGLRIPAVEGALREVVVTRHPVRTDTFVGTSLATMALELGVAAGVAVPVIVEGHVWGSLTTSTADSPLPAGTEERLLPFAELAAAAIANAQNKAQLRASRARLIATANETRRRLQRDVHDGAQQRLVQTIIALKLAIAASSKGLSTADLIREALAHAERANADLRDVVHGILPASLTQGGIRLGVESIAYELPLAVHLKVSVPRLTPDLETTAYFVVAEALNNVVKHAAATEVHVTIELAEGALSIEVTDNGIGGADPSIGSGLTGLSDRVEAAEGRLSIISNAGAGTKLGVILPVAGPG